MAMASPTPMGSSHFASLPMRRPASRQTYKQPPTRQYISRAEPQASELPSKSYSLNDSSDDDIPIPMMFSAQTKALLNDEASINNKTPPFHFRSASESYLGRGGPESGGISSGENKENISPLLSREQSPSARPLTRRVVRLSTTPGGTSLRRTGSLSSAGKRLNEVHAAPKPESPLDLSTPGQVPRPIRVPVGPSGNIGFSGGSSGPNSQKTGSGSRNDQMESQDYPTTIAKSHLATSQGSVSRYGPTTITRTRVPGKFLSGPARRGRRRMDDEEQSPIEEHGDGIDGLGASQEPASQESQAQDSQDRYSQVADSINALLYSSFASGSPVGSRDHVLDSVLRSRSPPPPTLSSARRSILRDPNSRPSSSHLSSQPAYKFPSRPILPSTHDKENDAPPTFKRNKQAPLIHLDQISKAPSRPVSMDLDALRNASPERRPLAVRSQNTPRRPAPPPPKMSILDAATSTAGAATTAQASGKRNRLKLNGKYFTRLDCIGRGGSSRVYRVMAENSKFFALKRVSLDDADETAVRGFKGEIDLLKKLESVERVIRLYDFELNEEKGTLSVLMEMGELDMNKMLELRIKGDQATFDASFARHYWKEMLECLQAIHEHDIVHSDLKPHNFVLVQGRLKLIDFGIANAIQTDETVNVHRETQIGTPNYMSPESLMDSNAKPDSRGRIPNEPKLMKLGKPSDIWSLGCILYQIVYGRAPFAHIANQMQRCQAIINWNHDIEFPGIGVGNVSVPQSVIKTLRRCLERDQHLRPSATELLNGECSFLYPIECPDNAIPMTEELLGRILQNVAMKCGNRMPTDAEILHMWPKGYITNLRQKLKEGKIL